MTHFEVEVRTGSAGWLRRRERYESLPQAVAAAAAIRSTGVPARVMEVRRSEVRQGSRAGWPSYDLRAG